MITNKDSVGYKLAETAISFAKVKSIGYAKDFLLREFRLNNFALWEQIAVIETFNTLLTQYKKVKI